MKKKCLGIALALCLLLSGAGSALGDDAPLRVTATCYPVYLAALNIIEEAPGISLACLATPSGHVHDYQMTTDDRRLLEDSDVIIMNGAGLEGFMDAVLPQLSARVIDASEGLALIETHGEVNPHIWVSPQGMMDQARNIGDGLSEIMPEHAAAFEVGANAYIGELAALYAQMALELAPYRGMPIMTFHEAFDYFAEAFELVIVATVEGGEDTAPSARVLAELADLIRAEGVVALFAETGYEDTAIETLSRETGVPMRLLDPLEAGVADPADPGAYIRIMEENLRVLLEAFA